METEFNHDITEFVKQVVISSAERAEDGNSPITKDGTISMNPLDEGDDANLEIDLDLVTEADLAEEEARSVAAMARNPVPGEDDIVRGYDAMAIKLAKLYAGSAPDEDLRQWARLGFIEAVRSFDVAKDIAFSTHMYNRARYAISHGLRRNTGVIHIPYRLDSKRDDPNVAAKIPIQVELKHEEWEVASGAKDFTRGADQRLELAGAWSLLSDVEQAVVFHIVVKGLTRKQARTLFGCKREAEINAVYSRAIHKLKAHFTSREIDSLDLLRK